MHVLLETHRCPLSALGSTVLATLWLSPQSSCGSIWHTAARYVFMTCIGLVPDLFCTVESHQNDLFLPSVPNDYTFFLPSKCFFKNCWDGILITLTSDRQPPDFDSVRTNSLGKPSSETVRRTCALEVKGPQISTGPLAAMFSISPGLV